MIWYFLAHCALLIGLFAWLDRRQMERYNGFARWSQVFSGMLGDDIHKFQDQIEGIHESVKELKQ
jgi:hypothetical protein